MLQWYLIRPDALGIFDDELIRENFSRYLSILKNETVPKFVLAKSFEVHFDKGSDIEELIKIHDRHLEDFMKFVQEYDEKQFKLKEVHDNFLELKIEIAERVVRACEFCEWKCKVDRIVSKGICGVRYKPKIFSIFVHLGEEAWITPSLTIFFAGCNFKCVYCQNWDISQNPENGVYISKDELAHEIESYSNMGVRNVNWVGGEPTPNLHYILAVLKNVKGSIPVVWNSNAYESEVGRKLLAGIVDIYLYDIKYGNDNCALKYSKVKNYFRTVTTNIKFAERYGELSLRHLILPNHIECCSKPILNWIKKNLSKYILNIMDQYRPEYRAYEYPEINRKISREEYNEVIDYAKKIGIKFKT